MDIKTRFLVHGEPLDPLGELEAAVEWRLRDATATTVLRIAVSAAALASDVERPRVLAQVLRLGSALVRGATHDDAFWRRLEWEGLRPEPLVDEAEAGARTWQLVIGRDQLDALLNFEH